jgi:peptide/nickel transport system ATP-binding protein
MVQAQVLRLLGDLVRDAGMSMLLISHDLSVLADACDRVAVMYAGRIVEQSPAASAFTDPVHPYTRALAAAFPVIGDPASRKAPRGLKGDPPDPRDLPSGCPFTPARTPLPVESSTSGALRRAGPRGGRVRCRRPRCLSHDCRATR